MSKCRPTGMYLNSLLRFSFSSRAASPLRGELCNDNHGINFCDFQYDWYSYHSSMIEDCFLMKIGMNEAWKPEGRPEFASSPLSLRVRIETASSNPNRESASRPPVPL